jgi:phage baseplate assembly protein V
MNTLSSLNDLARLLRNLIRTGIVTDVDTARALCRVETGGITTDWLNWLTPRVGRSRTWWAPSVGEQILVLAVGGEQDTAFVLPGIYFDDNPAPSASADALHISFPDGAVIEYEPQTGALTVSGIKTASVTASKREH